MVELSQKNSDTITSMVAVFVQALHAVQPSATTQDDHGEGVQQLVSDFDNLAGVKRDLVARAMTRLWDSFYDHFDGLQGFLAAEYPERYAYLEQLEVARERMARNGHGAAAHYQQATALMVAYLESAIQQQSLQARVAESAQRGRVLSRERPPIGCVKNPQIAQASTEAPRPALSLVPEPRLPSVDDPKWNIGATGYVA
jgi:hypothetical protein